MPSTSGSCTTGPIFLIVGVFGLIAAVRGAMTGSVLRPGRGIRIRMIERDSQPGFFWLSVGFWAIIAFVGFFYSGIF